MRRHDQELGRREVHVLVGEQHRLVRAGLRRVLEEHGAVVVAEAADARTLGRLAREGRAHVALVDGALAGRDLPELVSRLRTAHAGLEVVLTGDLLDDDLVIQALAAGACGYVPKHASPDAIGAAVLGAVAGESHVEPRVAHALVDRLRRRTPRPRGTGARLTERELEVLRLVARGGDNAEIAAELGISVSTVKQHVTRVCRKLGARNRVQAAVEAVRSDLA